ncbi:hypothetical protein [Mesonia mobilis]|uniref:Uncharacterized protein n=1 Tax=Mesonia mobilis TaxID=369791 RepID=A0ABQ3BKB3_9FLAO|nr:hypothetical protein [Mesonia mobilis]MBQ0737615.1 hypothetical protein [Aquimarina celericrescens]GGZ49007.1 hypothetical protein GCM10008088_07930 [Mesonia mobilis]
MKHKLQSIFNFKLKETKYFWIAIILIGTIGIWLPCLIGNGVKKSEIPILFTTYYISIYFSGCLDSVINKIKFLQKPSHSEEIINRFLTIIFMIIVAIALVVATILLTANEYFFLAITTSVIGTLISLGLWWNNNWEGETFYQDVRNDVKKKHSENW